MSAAEKSYIIPAYDSCSTSPRRQRIIIKPEGFVRLDHDVYVPELTGYDRGVLGALIKLHPNEVPTRHEIASIAGFGKDATRKALANLVRLGVVAIRKVVFNGKLREIFDVLPKTNWSWLRTHDEETQGGIPPQDGGNPPADTHDQGGNPPTQGGIPPQGSGNPPEAPAETQADQGVAAALLEEQEAKKKIQIHRGKERTPELVPDSDAAWVDYEVGLQMQFELPGDKRRRNALIFDVLKPWVQSRRRMKIKLQRMEEFTAWIQGRREREIDGRRITDLCKLRLDNLFKAWLTDINKAS